jgi:hypothetical protein
MRTLLPLGIVPLLLPTAIGAQEPPPALPAWLTGCWQSTRGDVIIEEQWMAPRARSMVGMSRTTRGAVMVGFELVVVRMLDGQLVYEAHPSNQPSATFRLEDATDTTIVFTNPEHDFPQRIGYERTRADSVRAWIDGTVDGTVRTVTFEYVKKRCAVP